MILEKYFDFLAQSLFIKYLTIALALVVLIGVCSNPLRAAETMPDAIGSISCVYDLLADGDDIGDIIINRSQNGDADQRQYHIKESWTVKVSGFWGLWEMTSTGETVVDQHGLLSFDHKITENDNKWRVFSERHDQELWCSVRKVLSEKEKDDKDNEGDLQISLVALERTASQLPSVLMQNSKGLRKKTLRVLNTTELEAGTFLFEEAGQEHIEIAGQTFGCRVFSVTTPEGNSTYWLAEDTLGAFIVKESGRDGDGPYEIILRKYDFDKKEGR